MKQEIIFDMQEVKYIKWYHWLFLWLLPKTKSIDSNIIVEARYGLGHIWITKVKKT